MHKDILTALIFVLLLFVHTNITAAENNQSIVIGVGTGFYDYDEQDDFQKSNNNISLSLPTSMNGQFYAEWYGYNYLGFGLRSQSIYEAEVSVGLFNGDSGEKTLSVSNLLATINWVPIGLESYTRLILMAGIGTSDYHATSTLNGVTTLSGSTSGTAKMFGIYLDWGGEGFGARIGKYILQTDLGSIDGLNVDASGESVNFELRWAFK